MSKFLTKRQRQDKLRKQQQEEAERKRREKERKKLENFSFSGQRVEASIKPQKDKLYRRSDDLPKYPSHVSDTPFQPAVPERYEGEMAERELKAQEEIERKKKRVAVLYNKGAYQLITPGMDPKTIGRK